MQQALLQAKAAGEAGEVPVGAVMVHGGRCIAAAGNAPIARQDPTAHAEINVLRAAALKQGNYRLQGCTLYVTLEPCAMCAMALLHARVDRVVFGAYDHKTGAAGSAVDLFANKSLNHRTEITAGVLEQACAELLQQFFGGRRLEAKTHKTRLREDALRTPEMRFDTLNIPQGQYVSSLPSLQGLRLHYHYLLHSVDCACGEHQNKVTVLCIHDAHGFSQQYLDFARKQALQGVAVLMPDLIGFGRSDKPKKMQWHQSHQHAAVLNDLVKHLHIDGPLRIILPVSMGALLKPLTGFFKQQIEHITLVRHLPELPEEVAFAPFADAGYTAGIKALQRWELALPDLPVVEITETLVCT